MKIVANALLVLALVAGAMWLWRRHQVSSAQAFAADFYHWYPGFLAAENASNSFRAPFDLHPDWFDPKLAQAWRDAQAAQSKCEDIISGAVDSDPFYNTQDDPGPYTVGVAMPDGENYRVAVFSKANAGKPVAYAEIGREGGHWAFLNFLYPPDPDEASRPPDLLALLNTRQPCAHPKT